MLNASFCKSPLGENAFGINNWLLQLTTCGGVYSALNILRRKLLIAATNYLFQMHFHPMAICRMMHSAFMVKIVLKQCLFQYTIGGEKEYLKQWILIKDGTVLTKTKN